MQFAKLHRLLYLTALLLPMTAASQNPAVVNETTGEAATVVAVDTASNVPAAIDSRTAFLSLDDCVKIALSESPTVKVADLEVKRVEYAKKETQGNLLPAIDFSLAYQRTIELQTINMNMGGQSQSIKMGMDNSWNTGFSAQMPLVNAALWKSIQISETQILQNIEKARASRLDLVNSVNKTYYALMLAVASRDVINQNYEIALFNAQLFEKQFKAGTASEYDVLRSSVQVKNIEPELLQAEIAIKQCQLQLKLLMGIDCNSDFAIMPNVTIEEMRYKLDTPLSLVDRSLANNTSLRELDIQRKMLKQNVDLKKLAWVPTLGASFNINWNALSNGNALKNQSFNPYSNVALALSVPIFSGGTKYNALKQAQVQLQEIDLQRENLVNSLTMQLDLTIDNMNMEISQIASSEEGVKQADKALQIMQKSFEIGAASYLSLRDSELAHTTARLSYYQSIYNYLISSSELDMLLGKEDAVLLGMPIR